MVSFNSYNLRARIQPLILAWTPILIMPLALVPDVPFNWTVVRWIGLYFVFATLLVQLGRGRGRRLERRIHRGTGVKSSAAMLRHRDTRIDQHTKNRYLSFLGKNIRGMQLPSLEEERKLPHQSDERYGSAVLWLLAKTTDRGQFPLVFEENVNYGFRRNTWAQKRLVLWFNAIAITFVGIGYSGLIEFSGLWLQILPPGSPLLLWWIVIALMHSCLFAFVIKRRWVLEQSETFARRLLAACDRLEANEAEIEQDRSAAGRSK